MHNYTFQDHLNCTLCIVYGQYRPCIYCHCIYCTYLTVTHSKLIHLQLSRQLNYAAPIRLPNCSQTQPYRMIHKNFCTHLGPGHSKLKTVHFRTILIACISTHFRTILAHWPKFQLFKATTQCPFKLLLSRPVLCCLYTFIQFFVPLTPTYTAFTVYV